ncbi:hypothetical protein B0I35DRAFT_435725 [Stachybotrys elegans]|uniref:Transcription factor domain-containing protein n=1 Tax=Stachybotrys elegans TaxID=80388 RepID=A0A8K0SSE6_9HYPO|nr:hypothetical protein B0I35DRAFT_435725 [Stachybotrys elegans]
MAMHVPTAPASRVRVPAGRGGGCERCYRLNKECVPAPARKRGAKKQADDAAWKSQIEGRLDDLVSMLDTQRIVAPSPPIQYDSPLVIPASEPASYTSPGLPTCPSSVVEDLSIPAAEDCLRAFCSSHLKFLPFLQLPARQSAENLRLTRPLLWMNIQAVCATSPTVRVDTMTRIQEALARQYIVQREASLDLLLGLLTYMTWSFNPDNGKTRYYTSTNLAITMALDLRLDRPTGRGPSTVSSCGKSSAVAETEPSDHEGLRALLACFISSSTASLMVRHEAPRWSLHIDEAIRRLSQDSQEPDDHVLAAIAKIVTVAGDAAKLTWCDAQSNENVAPPALFAKGLLWSLSQVTSTLGHKVVSNKVVSFYLHSAEALITEKILFQNPTSSVNCDTTRLEALGTCLKAAKQCIETFLSLDATELIGVSSPAMMHLSHSLQTIYRLSLLEEPGWDRVATRKAADVLFYLERVADKFDQVAHLDGRNSMFFKLVDTLKATSAIWSATLNRPSDVLMVSPPSQPMDGSLDINAMGFIDDSWFTQSLSPWNGQEMPPMQ